MIYTHCEKLVQSVTELIKKYENECHIYLVLLLSTHSLDPCLWGESHHPAFDPPASLSLHLASSSITTAGSVHKSRGDSVVRI